MSSYTGDPGEREIDEVRLWLGDTGRPRPGSATPIYELTDAEIQYFLDRESTPLAAAAAAARALAGRYTHYADATVGDVREELSAKAARYLVLADDLDNTGGGGAPSDVRPSAGGLSPLDFEPTGTVTEGYFYEGMFSPYGGYPRFGDPRAER